jgi:hypothetical protein
MPMSIALTVRFRGEMTQATLLRLREQLGLKRQGRLTDAEDAAFGYRYLQHDELNWIDLDLWRQDDTHWSFLLTYLKEPPAREVVEQELAGIRAALAELGFTIEDVAT